MMIYGDDGSISESIKGNHEGFGDGSRAKGSKRVGTQDFEISEKMAFVGELGVIGPGEWVRSVPEGSVCRNLATRWFYYANPIVLLPDLKQLPQNPHFSSSRGVRPWTSWLASLIVLPAFNLLLQTGVSPLPAKLFSTLLLLDQLPLIL